MCLTNICAWIPFCCDPGSRVRDSGFDYEYLRNASAHPVARVTTHTFQCCCFSEQTQHVFEVDQEKPLLQRKCVPIEKKDARPIEEQVAALFEKYKKEKNWLWIREALLLLPKCELHNHLVPDPDNNLAYAAEKNLTYNLEDKKFIDESALKNRSLSDCLTDFWSRSFDTGPRKISAKEMLLCPKGLEYQSYFNTVTLPDQLKTPEAQNHFFDSFATILSTNMPLDRQLCGEIKKLIADNIPYAELTIDFQPANRPQLPNFSLERLEECYEYIRPWCEGYVEMWISKLNFYTSRVASQLQWEHAWNSAKNPITIGFLAEIMRIASLEARHPTQALAAFFIDAAAAMTLCQKDPQRVLGINVVGPEHNALAKAQRVDQMHVLDYLYHKLGNPNISLHAGEITAELSLVSDMKDALSLAIDKGHAKRIGHGLCLEKSQNAYSLMKEMKDKNVLIETCLTSNSKIFGVDLQQHPIKTYLQEKVKIALGTDDPHILNTTLTEEFLKAVKNYDCTYQQIKAWIRNSIEFSFLPGESLFDHSSGESMVKAKFQALLHLKEVELRQADKRAFESSWKARMQILVEKKLAEREKEILELHKP